GQKDIDGAIVCYRKAIALAPKDAVAHHNLGHSLKTKGNLEEAIAYYRHALALEPRLPTNNLGVAYGMLGQGFVKQGQYAQGREAMLQVLKLCPAPHPAQKLAQNELMICEDGL